jgi:hypothetical protein
MTDEELEKLLSSKQWTVEMQDKLIAEWNARRNDLPNIGRLSVRTPCRLRQIVSSFKIFLQKN